VAGRSRSALHVRRQNLEYRTNHDGHRFASHPLVARVRHCYSRRRRYLPRSWQHAFRGRPGDLSFIVRVLRDSPIHLEPVVGGNALLVRGRVRRHFLGSCIQRSATFWQVALFKAPPVACRLTPPLNLTRPVARRGRSDFRVLVFCRVEAAQVSGKR